MYRVEIERKVDIPFLLHNAYKNANRYWDSINDKIIFGSIKSKKRALKIFMPYAIEEWKEYFQLREKLSGAECYYTVKVFVLTKEARPKYVKKFESEPLISIEEAESLQEKMVDNYTKIYEGNKAKPKAGVLSSVKIP